MSLNFRDLSKAISKQFAKMTTTGLFRVTIDPEPEVEAPAAALSKKKAKELEREAATKPSKIWDTYLGAFPEGANPMYLKRTEHDCSCCRGFIKKLGSVVSIVNGQIVTLWDCEVGGQYQPVVDKMAELVRASALANGIHNLFLHKEPVVGVAKNRQLLPDKMVKEWEHFFVTLPGECVATGEQIGPKQSDTRATHDVMLRSLKELTLDSVDTVLDLIAQNSLYRGEEQKFAVSEFRKLKIEFDKLGQRAVGSAGAAAQRQDLFVWTRLKVAPPSVTRIRNTAIGTLLVELSEGKELEDAVKGFEKMVAPTNYKRPTALVTKAMIAKAQEKLQELGFMPSLERRYAVIEDITVRNTIWADREAKKAMNVFDDIAARIPEKSKSLDKVEEMTILDFTTKILPVTKSLEVMVENGHAGNFVSLIAPADPTAKLMFKWGNGFCWDYAGGNADSLKERVKRAGGKVDADFCARLGWSNGDDLDLHLIEPGGNRIFYGAKVSRTGGQLDVDMNAGGPQSRTPVENIFYAKREQMPEGTYLLAVNQYNQRERIDVGFEVELSFDGVTYNFHYEKAVSHQQTIPVAEFKYTRKDGLVFSKGLPNTQASRVVWGIPTQTFRKVRVVMASPNHWDGHGVGNRHTFFMLDGCLREEKARGFYNEFLNAELDAHRKVLEIVGAKMKTEESDRQLSGLGFSSTQRNHLLCKVAGSFTRTLKVTF